MVTSWWIGALLAGLVGSPHCVGMCGGFAALAADRSLEWHAGRLITYGSLGAIAGAVGGSLPVPPALTTALSIGLVLLFTLSLGGWMRPPEIPLPGLSGLVRKAMQSDRAAGPILFGIATALLPCGLVYSTLGLALGSGSGITGAGVMVVFGLGTVPLLASLGAGLRRWTGASLFRRRLVAVAVAAACLGSIGMRHDMQANVEGDPPSCH